jgi:putative transposase
MWKAKYGSLGVSKLKRLKECEQENTKLKRMYAELALENRAMKDASQNLLLQVVQVTPCGAFIRH